MLKIQIMDMLLPWLLKTGGKLLITVLIAVIGYKVIRAIRKGVGRSMEKGALKITRNAIGKTLASQDQRKGCLEEGTNIRLMWTRWLMSLQDAVLWMGQRKFEVD